MDDTYVTLSNFFNKTFEKDINSKMMYYSYEFEYEKIYNYIKGIVDIPLNDFINYILNNYDVFFLEACDVVQFSDFEDCTKNICREIKDAGDKGYKFIDIGKLLLNDGKIRKDGAYIKYGENHAKTAKELGLLTSLSNTYFLSCFGYIFNDISTQDQEKLICRLILRNKLIKRLIYRCQTADVVLYDDEVSFLSLSTINRRKPNIIKLISIIIRNSDSCIIDLVSKIK